MGTWMIGGGATRDPECDEDLAEDVEELRAAFPNQEKVSNREPLL